MDQFDRATELEEAEREACLAAAMSHHAMQPCGYCYNCDAEIEAGCFCDADCRDDYEKRTRKR